MEVRKVATSFLKHKDKILLMKRSEGRDFGGKWAGVSGNVEAGEAPLVRAFREIKEETGIENIKLLKKGRPFRVRDYGTKTIFFVFPFLFEVDSDSVSLEREHSEFAWISPEQVERYETVPRLKEALDDILQ